MSDLFNKKHYEWIARKIKLASYDGKIDAQELVDDFCHLFKFHNHRFDEDKFKEACGINGTSKVK